VVSRGPGSWIASCPTAAHKHGDRSRGLSIREEADGRLLVHCFAGCDVASIVGAVGLQLSDLFPPRSHPENRYAGTQPARRWADPWALLAAIKHAATVVRLAAGDIAAGVAITPADAEYIERVAAELEEKLEGAGV